MSEDQALLKDILAELRAMRHTMNVQQDLMNMLAVEVLFNGQQRDPKHIIQTATHVYSQNYEDSIIAEIYSRIGEKSRFFVEIGIETGVECNTRTLLDLGWSGVWIDGNKAAIDVARENMRPYVDAGRLKIINSFVTAENIDGIIKENVASPIDFLSVDVDHNTSHIWRGISAHARVTCVEYNASFPPSSDWEIPYDPNKWWDGSNQYGASLKALERIGRQKGSALVGCDFNGVNAFFVSANECGNKFIKPYTAERHFQPPRYPLAKHRAHWAQPKAVFQPPR